MSKAKPIAKKKKYDFEVLLNENFNIVIVFIVGLFLIAAYFLFIKPQFEITLVGIKDSVSQKRAFYYEQKQHLIDLKATVALYKKLDTADLEKIKVILPNEYAKEKLFGELEDIISQQGVLVSSITLNKLSESDEKQSLAADNKGLLDIPNSNRIGLVQIDISLTALDYNAFKSILSLLESNLQLLDIQSLGFNPEEKTATFSMFTYYFK